MPASPTSRTTHAQYGQDVLAEYLLKKNFGERYVRGYKGTFVDVGACWPIQVSNTYFFYERGWRGLCLDANPDAAAAFERDRPEDKFVSSGVGDGGGALTYYTFTNAQWNCFDPKRKKSHAKHFTGEVEIPIRPLSGLITEHLGPGADIDLMSIDTEGFELSVLQSLDLTVHRPRLIILELIKPVHEAASDPIVTHLTDRGYTLKAHTGHDAFFIDI